MIIGITGGVGCGKSTVLHILEEKFGCALIETDKAGHQVMEPGQEAYQRILLEFGRDIMLPDGRIDRKKLGDIVFRDREKLEKLNQIVHPAVKKLVKEMILDLQNKKQKPVIVIESALLLEEHYDELCDDVWYIYTEDSVRIQRLAGSRGYTEEKTRNIMKNQKSDEEFRRLCKTVIDNSGSEEDTCKQIQQIFGSYDSEEYYGGNK